MNLRKQLVAAFLTVAILPLLIVGVYIFVTNLILAADLHQQNLRDSTQIQADLVEDNINRLMARARKFTSSPAVRTACENGEASLEDAAANISADVLSFTDETLDNVAVFALLDQKGNFLYTSGSNSDILTLKAGLALPLAPENQYIAELQLAGQSNSLAIYTPVQLDGETVGCFVVVCRTDYLLKLISSHRQLESSNAMIYCRAHKQLVTYKQEVTGSLQDLERRMEAGEKGALFCKLDGKQSLAYYRSLAKTPWVLVSTVSAGQIFSQVWSYVLINIAALLVVFLAVLFLSRRQSRKMLYPLDQLLQAVEKFFLGGATHFPQADIDPKSEIGYLAEKFAGLSEEIALAQGKLRESNYLYAALLRATYEFRVAIDFQADTLECSSGALAERMEGVPGETAPERLLALFAAENQETGPDTALYRIAYGKLAEPAEAEIGFTWNEHAEKSWYRVVAVPVMQAGGVSRVVLHFEDITAQKREEQRLIASSQTDLLCGVYNKVAFSLHCRLSGQGKTDAVFFIDIDQFKQVNDTLGHGAGDNVLVSAAHAICAQFRESDVVGRFGGDEFVVFAPGISRQMAEQKASRLLETLSFHLDTPRGAAIHVTASIGICMVASDITLERAVKLADEAMYRAKRNGRAQYYITQTEQ